MRRRVRWAAGLAAGAVAFAGMAGTAPAGAKDRGPLFERLATYPVYQNGGGGESVAEISAVGQDGRTLIYTDAPGKRIGFLDLGDPGSPRGLGTIELGYEPTSVAVVGQYALVVIDTSKSHTEPSGRVDVVRVKDRKTVRSIELGGQPDSIAVSGKYAAIAIENERDEEFTPAGGEEGDLPQAPGGFLQILDLEKENDPASWGLRKVPFTQADGSALPAFVKAGLDTPQDPEPEYVSINGRGEVAVTLQENNGVAIVDLRTGRVERVFSAGKVTVTGIDTEEDGRISLTGSIQDVPREPDSVAWIDDEHLATANEGDWKGGTRGWTVFDDRGKVVWDAGNSFEHLAVRYGQHNDDRAENKGAEPEGLTVATYKGRRYAFVGSERSNFVAVYDVSRPSKPGFVQFLPTNAGPEGLLAVPSRGLFIVSSETDDASVGLRAGVQVFGLGKPKVPGLVSASQGGAPIGWGALSGLSAVPGSRDGLYAVWDSAYKPTEIFTIDTGEKPATITKALTVTKGGAPAAYDAEGIAARPGGGFWLASEGAKGPQNLLVRLDASGAVQQEIPLPADVAAGLGGQGFEGVTVVGSGGGEQVWVTLQRPVSTDPADVVRLGRYTPSTGAWAWFGYRLQPSASTANWNGLSEITYAGGRLLLVERDKASGIAAAHKKVYSVALPTGDPEGLPVLAKTLERDLLPDLKGFGGWVQEKVEGLGVTGGGRVWIATDNDAVNDATGETVFYSPGTLKSAFER